MEALRRVSSFWKSAVATTFQHPSLFEWIEERCPDIDFFFRQPSRKHILLPKTYFQLPPALWENVVTVLEYIKRKSRQLFSKQIVATSCIKKTFFFHPWHPAKGNWSSIREEDAFPLIPGGGWGAWGRWRAKNAIALPTEKAEKKSGKKIWETSAFNSEFLFLLLLVFLLSLDWRLTSPFCLPR